MSSSSSTNIRTCYCGDRVGMWTSWTRKNPGRRFFGCPNYMDEEKDCGYFRWIDPPLLNKWYKERMYELGAVANGGVAIPFNNPVNEGEIPVDGPIAPVNVDVPIALRMLLNLIIKLQCVTIHMCLVMNLDSASG
ncbi:unnamed protein product [Lactuca saligna]|uniref:GRF-type domain-containing protein n=1 Tax=Lactuca saligna TaxID=75948 RepID=A0AA35ZZ28_LACSI|nr:unnamed protein product [Lactuca saligna]